MVGSHASAARVHGFDFLDDPGSPVTVTSTIGYDRRSPTCAVHVAELPSDQRCLRYGTPFTSPARTAIDLARMLPFRDAVVMADSALRYTPTETEDLHKVLDSCAGWPGIGTATEATAFADPLAESAFESVSRVILAEQGLPPPQTQVWLSDGSEPIGRVDFYWPEYNTVGEADGLKKYATPDVLRAEKLRQERLEEAGYEVVRWNWHQMFRLPAQTAARLWAAFNRGR